jgi:hypothetical protein
MIPAYPESHGAWDGTLCEGDGKFLSLAESDFPGYVLPVPLTPHTAYLIEYARFTDRL